MSVAHDYESMHHFVDRLTPAQVRKLRLLVVQDEEFAPLVPDEREPESPQAGDDAVPAGMLALFGSVTDGPDDVSERHDDYVRARMRRHFGDVD